MHAAAVLRNAPATLDLGPAIRSGRARRRPDALPVAGAKLKLIPLPSPHALGSVAAQPRVLTHYKNQHRHSPCACRQRRPILPERLDADGPPGRSERQRRLQIRATWPWACAGRTSSRDRSRPGDPPRHQRRNTPGPWPVYPPRRPPYRLTGVGRHLGVSCPHQARQLASRSRPYPYHRRLRARRHRASWPNFGVTRWSGQQEHSTSTR